MKRFLKKRWHHLPVGIITAILLVCLLAGSAFAAFMVWNGNAYVTVNEAITVTNTGGDGGEDFTGSPASWNVSLYPGQSKILNVLVSNAAPNALTVGTSCSPGELGVTAVWSGDTTVPGGGSKVLTLTVTAGEDASTIAQEVYFEITRG